MARYADEGARVMVVTLTGGERGDILNPAMDLPEVHGRIHEIRIDEMAKAAEILGVEHALAGLRRLRTARGRPAAAAARGLLRAGAAGRVHRAAGPGDPRVQAARADHLRRERRLSASRPHPLPRGVDGRLRGGRRLPAVSRTRASRGASRSCTTTTASCGSACSCSRTSSPRTARWARSRSGSRTGIRSSTSSPAGSPPASSARSTSPSATTPCARTPPRSTRRASSSPRPWSGSSGCGRPRSTSWRAPGFPSTLPEDDLFAGIDP